MRLVKGRVVVRGSKLGVPGLLVSVFEANPAAASPCQSEEGIAHEGLHYRLGSVLTNSKGTFLFNYQCEEICGRKQRPDLMIAVSTPDEGCNPDRKRVAWLACCFRRNVASLESFLIHVDKARLTEAGIHIPGDEDAAGQRRAKREQHRADARQLFIERLQARRDLMTKTETYFKTFLAALSAVPAGAASSRYVARGASVLAANRSVIQDGIEGRINKAVAVGLSVLSEDQIAKLKGAKGDLDGSELQALLRPKGMGQAVMLVRGIPSALRCCEKPAERCVEVLKGKADDAAVEASSDTPSEGSGTTDDGVPLSPGIPSLIENLMKYVSPPESMAVFTVPHRAGLEDIQRGINGFALHSGPADAPSLHDFHHLQVAFEPVWQELFDKGVIEKGKSLYSELVELGVDPNEYLLGEDLQIAIDPSAVEDAAEPEISEPPIEVVREFDISPQQWSALGGMQDYQEVLKELAADIEGYREDLQKTMDIYNATRDSFSLVGTPQQLAQLEMVKKQELKLCEDRVREKQIKAGQIIGYADQKLDEPKEFDHFHKNMMELGEALKEPYRFSIYAADHGERSVNFGIIATYRQRWEPVSYQVGELVKTIPLAPKEVRRFSKKVSVRKSRSEKEVESSLRSRRTESAQTVRAETEIIQKAANKTNFQLNAEGGLNIGIASAKGSTAFAQDAATDSQEVKKEFREAVFKAAEEYKQERTLEINISTTEEASFEESGEISNPNDEIPVTYLFYELQRRYRVAEEIHRVTPIVLVAQEFPTPDQITESWIIAHDWILRRVILDDSFLPAMSYLASKVVGDEHALQEMYQSLQQQRRMAEELKEEIVAIAQQVGRRYAALQKSIERRADAVEAEEGEGFFQGGVEALFGSNDASPEALRVREDAARDAYEREAKQEKELQARLERETTALNALTEAYTKALSEHLNRKTQILRLRVHIKSNIMYYMQAIWSHEPPDQRFFRLHEVAVPKLAGKMTYTIQSDPDAIPMPPDWKKPQKLVVKCELDPNLESETLEQAADLDNLLGFKGNYMMFPLKKSNALTDFMLVPYLDAVTGIHDPDPLGNWTLHDFLKYACCLYRKLPKDEFDELLPALQAVYQQLANAPRSNEEIIVPTDSLFIEALPGVHPILEDFKLFHRVADVKKVQAEVRGIELENIRLAARLFAGEREDPTIEKKIVVEGGESLIVSPDGN